MVQRIDFTSLMLVFAQTTLLPIGAAPPPSTYDAAPPPANIYGAAPPARAQYDTAPPPSSLPSNHYGSAPPPAVSGQYDCAPPMQQSHSNGSMDGHQYTAPPAKPAMPANDNYGVITLSPVDIEPQEEKC